MNFPEWTIRAEETDKGYVINGIKVFCTNSDEADVYVVFTIDYENGFSMGAYIVEKGTPGREPGHLEQFGKRFELNRTRMGQPLASFQVVAHHIAEMSTKIEFSRNMIYNAAKLFDEVHTFNPMPYFKKTQLQLGLIASACFIKIQNIFRKEGNRVNLTVHKLPPIRGE
ncbi:MAG: acyl-CoA dehydrogenase family protein [Dehalobacterium sp.]